MEQDIKDACNQLRAEILKVEKLVASLEKPFLLSVMDTTKLILEKCLQHHALLPPSEDAG
jgi:hypothetical protein